MTGPPAESITPSGNLKFSGTKRWSTTFAFVSWLLPTEVARVEAIKKLRSERKRAQAARDTAQPVSPQPVAAAQAPTHQQPATGGTEQAPVAEANAAGT